MKDWWRRPERRKPDCAHEWGEYQSLGERTDIAGRRIRYDVQDCELCHMSQIRVTVIAAASGPPRLGEGVPFRDH